jgi:hypothetical protein
MRALRPGGSVIFKCFDTRPPRDFGPPGLTVRDIIDTLGLEGHGIAHRSRQHAFAHYVDGQQIRPFAVETKP